MGAAPLSRRWLVIGLLALGACAEPVPEAPCPGVLSGAGDCRLACASDDECLLSEACEDGACRALEAPRPAILAFEGPSAPVAMGARADLRFRTAFAARILLGPEGAPGRRLDGAEGTAEIGPLEASGVYVLVAESPTGRAEARARIEVGDDRPEVRIERFEVSPARLAARGEVTLRWAVVDAEGPVRIVAGEQVVVGAGPAEGEATWPVEETTAFALSAPGFPEPAFASATAIVETVAPGSIVDFSALPSGAGAPLARRRGVLLRWETTGGAALELTEAGRGLATLDRAPELARGAWLVAPPSGASTVYGARLVDGTPMPPERTVSVDVAPEAAAPIIAAFEVSPQLLDAEDSTTVEVSWRVTGSARRVELRGPGSAAAVAPVDSRRVRLSPDRSAVFRIRAEGPGGVAEARAVVWRLVDEGESNDRPDDARELDGVGARGAVRSLGGLGDVDWFEVDAEEGGRLEARLLPPCERGLRLRVIDAGMQLAGEDTATGSGCPRVLVTPTRGTYFLRVDRPGLSLRTEYRVVADAVGPACGDGVRAASEGCDDGNRAPGDGCSEACTREPGWGYRAEAEEAPNGSLPTGQTLLLHPPRPGDDVRDAGFAVVDLGNWTFPFFGEAHAGLAVHVDGYLSFFPDMRDPNLDVAAPVGSGAPNAFVAPFLADLRMVEGSRLAALPTTESGEPAIDVVFEGLEPKSSPGSRLSAVVRLLRSGEIEIRYPTGASTPADDVEVRAGLEAPRGLRFVSVPTCRSEACAMGELVGREIRFRPQ